MVRSSALNTKHLGSGLKRVSCTFQLLIKDCKFKSADECSWRLRCQQLKVDSTMDAGCFSSSAQLPSPEISYNSSRQAPFYSENKIFPKLQSDPRPTEEESSDDADAGRPAGC